MFPLILIEIALRIANGVFGLVPSIHQIDPFCQPFEVVALRPGQDFTGFWQYDELLVRRWLPNVQGLEVGFDEVGNNQGFVSIKVNDKGWRDFPREYQKQRGVYRIAVVGDSYGEPWRRPLEDGVGYQLEQWLNGQDVEQAVEVINLSVSGNNPVDYSLIVRHEVPKYDPDLVVVLLYRNDIFDGQFVNLLSETAVQDGRIVYSQERIDRVRQSYAEALQSPAIDGNLTWDELEVAKAEGRLIVDNVSDDGVQSYAVLLETPQLEIPVGLEFHCLMQHNSRLYTWLKDKVRILRDQAEFMRVTERELWIYHSQPDETLEVGWVQYEGLLQQIAGDANDQGSDIAFVNLAAADQVYTSILDAEMKWVGLDSGEIDPEYPLKRTQEICVRNNLICWHLLPSIVAAAQVSEVQLFDYFDPTVTHTDPIPPVFGHYTPTGYRLVAEFIGEQIITSGLIA